MTGGRSTGIGRRRSPCNLRLPAEGLRLGHGRSRPAPCNFRPRTTTKRLHGAHPSRPATPRGSFTRFQALCLQRTSGTPSSTLLRHPLTPLFLQRRVRTKVCLSGFVRASERSSPHGPSRIGFGGDRPSLRPRHFKGFTTSTSSSSAVAAKPRSGSVWLGSPSSLSESVATRSGRPYGGPHRGRSQRARADIDSHLGPWSEADRRHIQPRHVRRRATDRGDGKKNDR